VFLRFFLLGIKPPHFDEGINGWFVDQVVHNGFYRYDPTNYHGPLHGLSGCLLCS
jgi:predicted membrane-bound mannosyltransferase